MGYLMPANAPISCSWQCHKNRNPPSGEPGTDVATAYGVNLYIAEAGRVSVIDRSPSGAEGRRLSVDLDDGRRVSYIHLDRIADNAYVGQRVIRGQNNIIWSGASGYGVNWYYGPHVHVSLWERPGMPYNQTIDFMNYVGDNGEEEDMTPEQDARLKNIENYLAVPGAGYGWPQVAGQSAQQAAASGADIQRRIAVPDAGYDWLPAINNKVDSLWKPVAGAAAGVALLVAALIGVVTLAAKD